MFHGLHDLSIQHSTAFKSFVSGSDTFVSLPTGHSKSLIYQLAIPLMKDLSKRSDELSFHFPSHPMLLVVSLLTALINDQINSCERLGFMIKVGGLQIGHIRPGFENVSWENAAQAQ